MSLFFRFSALCLIAAVSTGGVQAQNSLLRPKAPTLPPSPAVLEVPPIASEGIFKDKEGIAHPWSITPNHVLRWDDRPFVPVGGLFQVRSWTGTPTASDWESDIAALKALKAKNVTDIYLQPARVGLTNVPPEAIQRLIDYLDTEGFTYGISINDGPRDILTGYLVRPGAYRQEIPVGQASNVSIAVDNVANALYFLVTKDGKEIVQSGTATMGATGAQFTAPSTPDEFVALLLPQKIYFARPTGGGVGLPNVWDGFDTYRDTLLTLFRKVKFGKGFRFFLDVLPPDLTVTGNEEDHEVEHLIPTGAGFRSEWEEWLTRKYKSIDTLLRAWAVSDFQVKDFAQAAQLVPLWSGGKGVEYLEDLSAARQYKVMTGRSLFWSDLRTFKTLSVQGYMSDLAHILKQSVANVPVVYRSRGYSPLFSSLSPRVAFDGIGMEVYGRGSDLIMAGAGDVYTQVSEARKPLWMPVVATADAPPNKKTAKGYTSQLTLHADLDWLREIGARGYYVNGVRVTDLKRAAFDLSDMPDQLGWLSEYSRILVATGVGSAAAVPNAVFYPRAMQVASLRPLASGAWWLPTDRPGVAYNFGSAGRAYALGSEDSASPGTVYYLFSPSGTRRIHLSIPKASLLSDGPHLQWYPEIAGELNRKKRVLELTIGPDPVRIVNLDSLPVPTEAFPEVTKEAETLVRRMRATKSLDTARYESQISILKGQYNEDQPFSSVQEMLGIVTVLQSILRPYTWLEAERTSRQTFDEIGDRAGASGGQVLLVDPRSPTMPYAKAAYSLEVKEGGVFNVWIAASPDAHLKFQLDGHPMLDEITPPVTIGKPYANGTLVWKRIGAATIPSGGHTMEIRAEGPTAIDVILLTRYNFTPDGPNPPAFQP